MILVDTSVLIDLLRGKNNNAVNCFYKVIQEQIPFGITSVIYQEILQGAKTQKEYSLLDKYLRCQRFYHPKDAVETFGHAAHIYYTCRRQGVTVRSTIDCLIAQITIEHDLFLLQNDIDFQRMAPIVGLNLYRI